jgi:hypothetical protein
MAPKKGAEKGKDKFSYAALPTTACIRQDLTIILQSHPADLQ